MKKFSELPEIQNTEITTPEEKSFLRKIEELDTLPPDDVKYELLYLLDMILSYDRRFIIERNGKPIAAFVPIVDHQMLIDYVQHEVDPCRWNELVNNTREKLGLNVITEGDINE